MCAVAVCVTFIMFLVLDKVCDFSYYKFDIRSSFFLISDEGFIFLDLVTESDIRRGAFFSFDIRRG